MPARSQGIFVRPTPPTTTASLIHRSRTVTCFIDPTLTSDCDGATSRRKVGADLEKGPTPPKIVKHLPSAQALPACLCNGVYLGLCFRWRRSPEWNSKSSLRALLPTRLPLSSTYVLTGTTPNTAISSKRGMSRAQRLRCAQSHYRLSRVAASLLCAVLYINVVRHLMIRARF